MDVWKFRKFLYWVPCSGNWTVSISTGCTRTVTLFQNFRNYRKLPGNYEKKRKFRSKPRKFRSKYVNYGFHISDVRSYKRCRVYDGRRVYEEILKFWPEFPFLFVISRLFPVIPEISYLFLVPFPLSISVKISVKFPCNFRVSEVQFIFVRFPTVVIPLRLISTEHRITEFSGLRIALTDSHALTPTHENTSKVEHTHSLSNTSVLTHALSNTHTI